MNINQIVAKLANVSQKEYTDLVEVRGMRPSKALFRLGVEQQLAGLLGTLKLASTADEIDIVYSNTQVLSCMTGQPVGEFYAHLDLQVIYNDRYRCVVEVQSNWASPRGYGILCHKLDPILRQVFNKGGHPELAGCLSSYYEVQPYGWGAKEVRINQYKTYKKPPEDIFIPYIDFLATYDVDDFEDEQECHRTGFVNSISVDKKDYEQIYFRYGAYLNSGDVGYMLFEKDFSMLESAEIHLQEFTLSEEYYAQNFGYRYVGIFNRESIYQNLLTLKYSGDIKNPWIHDRDTIEEAIEDVELPF